MRNVAILVTRPRAASDRFAQELRAAGLWASDAVSDAADDGASDRGKAPEIIISPLMQIRFLPDPIKIHPDETLIFTSQHALKAVMDTGAGPDRVRRDLSTHDIYCVGNRLAAQIKSHLQDHQYTRLLGAEPDVQSLYRRILADGATGPFLHLRGVHSRGNLCQVLRDSGRFAREQVVYDQLLCDLTPQARAALNREIPCVVPLFSPRSAAQFAMQARNARAPYVICLSQAVADALGDLAVESLTVVARPEGDLMRKAVLACAAAACRIETRPRSV